MGSLMIITAKHNGITKSLTVSQWAELLAVSKKIIYNRKTIGLSDQDAIDGRYKSKREKTNMSEDELSKMYREFNFNPSAAFLRRQKDAIR